MNVVVRAEEERDYHRDELITRRLFRIPGALNMAESDTLTSIVW